MSDFQNFLPSRVEYPKIFSIAPPPWGGKIFDCPPTVSEVRGQNPSIAPPHRLRSGGAIFSKIPIAPPVGGQRGSLARATDDSGLGVYR